jgi:membrane-associated protease RseP (regulator of RpoE activity)
VTDVLSLYAVYRVVRIRGDEVVQGILHPQYGMRHPVVNEALDGWEGTHFLHHAPEGTELTLVRPVLPRPAERWWLHLILSALTLLTTTIAGSYFAGLAPLRFAAASLGPLGVPVPVRLIPADLVPGLIFSVPIFLILLVHELGHYVVARRHGMDVSPPYFIPAPPWINVVGTFGAFIRLRSAMINRAVLLDVGAGGPLAGFLLALPAVLIGGALSAPVPAGIAARSEYVVIFGDQPIWLGGSLLFDGLASLVRPDGGGALLLHPLAFAGWLGLFITAMNLFPLAQLDGGHILYALVGARQRVAGLLFLAVLVVLGASWWGWWLWAALIVTLGRGTIGHPPVLIEEYPLGTARVVVGWACVAIFVLSFVRLPIHL